MLFTVLIPHARAADRHRAALSINRSASKLRGTTLMVATPMLRVVDKSLVPGWLLTALLLSFAIA